MLPSKLYIIWQSGFRGENILEINQSEIRIAYGSHVFFNELSRNEQSL